MKGICTPTDPCVLFCIGCGRQTPKVSRIPWEILPQPVRVIPVIPDLSTPVQTIVPYLGRLRLQQ